jgi:hypothetical protein
MAKRISVLCGAVIALAAVGSASAGVVTIGGGWKAIWDDSLDPFVDIQDHGLVGDAVHIEKSAEFTQGPTNGIFPSIVVVFQQDPAWTGPYANFIVIDDEIIKNSTGEDWTDFHMILMDHGEVFFRPDLTAASGGGGPIGFSIDPFTNAQFVDGDTRLDIDGGVVPDGGLWFPGGGLSDGQLWIEVSTANAGGLPKTFVLKEIPTPEPGTLALCTFGAVFVVGRKRR